MLLLFWRFDPPEPVEVRPTPEFVVSVAARDRLAEATARNVVAFAVARNYGGSA